MKDSSSYSVGKALAILLVGDQKTGKTGVAFSFPDPYILDLDMNLDSAVRVDPTKKFKYDTPAMDDKNLPRAEKDIYPHAMACLKAAATDPWVKTIVVDSLSTLSIHMCSYILAEASRIENKVVDKMRIQDYGTVLTLLQKLAAFLRATGKTVVVTSHQSWDEDEVTKAIRYTLAVPGQMKHNLGAFFTDVWGTLKTKAAMDKTTYSLRTDATGYHVALGASNRKMPSNIDITNKTPAEIGTLLLPWIAGAAQVLNPTAPKPA